MTKPGKEGKAKPARTITHERNVRVARPPPFRDLSAPSSGMTGRRGALEWNDPRPCASPVTGQRQGGFANRERKKPGHASRTGLRMTSASAPSSPTFRGSWRQGGAWELSSNRFGGVSWCLSLPHMPGAHAGWGPCRRETCEYNVENSERTGDGAASVDTSRVW